MAACPLCNGVSCHGIATASGPFVRSVLGTWSTLPICSAVSPLAPSVAISKAPEIENGEKKRFSPGCSLANCRYRSKPNSLSAATASACSAALAVTAGGRTTAGSAAVPEQPWEAIKMPMIKHHAIVGFLRTACPFAEMRHDVRRAGIVGVAAPSVKQPARSHRSRSRRTPGSRRIILSSVEPDRRFPTTHSLAYRTRQLRRLPCPNRSPRKSRSAARFAPSWFPDFATPSSKRA